MEEDTIKITDDLLHFVLTQCDYNRYELDEDIRLKLLNDEWEVELSINQDNDDSFEWVFIWLSFIGQPDVFLSKKQKKTCVDYMNKLRQDDIDFKENNITDFEMFNGQKA